MEGWILKTTREQMKIMQAALDGEKIEFIDINDEDDVWEDLAFIEDRPFKWGLYDYRIKQEPMEFYVNIYDDGQLAVHRAKKIATDQYLRSDRERKTIKVREVTE